MKCVVRIYEYLYVGSLIGDINESHKAAKLPVYFFKVQTITLSRYEFPVILVEWLLMHSFVVLMPPLLSPGILLLSIFCLGLGDFTIELSNLPFTYLLIFL